MPDYAPGSSPAGGLLDVAVVGAGLGGLYAVYRLRQSGFSVQAFEANGDVGGTWHSNRYPGCRCDLESIHYSYQFDDGLQQDWNWKERYAAQPEILSYVRHVADRFGLRRHIRFNTRVTAAAFQAAEGAVPSHWTLATGDGQSHKARFCVMASGCLSAPSFPDIPGRGRFAGDSWHTGLWPREGVDFTGFTVGIIGTGSSGVQCIPEIAEQAARLTVFQRTPAYVMPRGNHRLEPDYVREVKFRYKEIRAEAKTGFAARALEPAGPSALAVSVNERDEVYERWWRNSGVSFQGAFADLLTDWDANRTAADFLKRKIRATVRNPRVADLLMPREPLGCKRLCVDTRYYATYNRPNVTLVDVSQQPIDSIEPEGIRVGGTLHAVDAIVFATGFDGITGALLDMDPRGRNGLPLRDKWAHGARCYLGLATSGFPNLFTISGPGSPAVLANHVTCIEQHVDWIADCLTHMRDRGLDAIEAKAQREVAWVADNNEVATRTVRASCASWYSGANIPGKPRLFLPYVGGFPAWVDKCEQEAREGYPSFVLS